MPSTTTFKVGGLAAKSRVAAALRHYDVSLPKGRVGAPHIVKVEHDPGERQRVIHLARAAEPTVRVLNQHGE